MVRFVLLWTTYLFITTAYGQNDTAITYFSAKNGKILCLIEGKSGTMFQLGSRAGGHLSGYSLVFTDTLQIQTDTSTAYYSGKKIWIEKKKTKMYLFYKHKKYRIKKIENIKEINYNINSAYWWSSFAKMYSDISHKCPWTDFSWTDSEIFWESFNNKNSSYKVFIPFAKIQIEKVRDSILNIEIPRTELTKKLINNISSIDYSELKESLLKLPTDYSKYFGTVIRVICDQSPELFFKLAEDLPQKRDYIFRMPYRNSETMKRLKSVQTDSPVKKEFFQEKR